MCESATSKYSPEWEKRSLPSAVKSRSTASSYRGRACSSRGMPAFSGIQPWPRPTPHS